MEQNDVCVVDGQALDLEIFVDEEFPLVGEIRESIDLVALARYIQVDAKWRLSSSRFAVLTPWFHERTPGET